MRVVDNRTVLPRIFGLLSPSPLSHVLQVFWTLSRATAPPSRVFRLTMPTAATWTSATSSSPPPSTGVSSCGASKKTDGHSTPSSQTTITVRPNHQTLIRAFFGPFDVSVGGEGERLKTLYCKSLGITIRVTKYLKIEQQNCLGKQNDIACKK